MPRLGIASAAAARHVQALAAAPRAIAGPWVRLRLLLCRPYWKEAPCKIIDRVGDESDIRKYDNTCISSQ